MLALLALISVVALASDAAAGSDVAVPPTEDTRPMVVTQAITTTPEMLFVPVTPCRAVDTRNAVGKFGNGAARNYYIGGTFGFAPQGGKSGGCGIPTGAKAVSAIVKAVDPNKVGYIRAWAAGTGEPTATLLTYATAPIGGSGDVPLRSGAGTDMTVKNYTGTTHVTIDVTGYYIQQMQAYINPDGTAIDHSGRLVSSTRTGEGQYTLTWDRNVSNCSGQASSDVTGHIVSVYTTGSVSYIYSDTHAGLDNDYWLNVLINC